MKKYIKMSYNLSADGAYPPAIPKMEIESFLTIENDGANVFKTTIYNHSGSHMDAPNHVMPDGCKVTDFPIEFFVFNRPQVIEIEMKDSELFQPYHFEPFYDVISTCDLLLIKTGYGLVRDTERERYIHKGPGFSIEGAEYIRNNFPSLRGLGLDFISLAAIEHLDEGMEAHRVLFRGNRQFVILEDLYLNEDLTKLSQVIALPWLINGTDSAPCTILGVLGE